MSNVKPIKDPDKLREIREGLAQLKKLEHSNKTEKCWEVLE